MAINFSVYKDMAAGSFKPFLFKNPYKAEDDAENIVNPLEGKLWNTGMAVANQAHAYDDCGVICGDSYIDNPETADKVDYGFNNSGLIDGEVGPEFKNRHIAAIRLYKNNEYVYLLPGDELGFVPKTYQEALYYLNVKDSDILVLANRSEEAEDSAGNAFPAIITEIEEEDEEGGDGEVSGGGENAGEEDENTDPEVTPLG